jgi:hypothetical protein
LEVTPFDWFEWMAFAASAPILLYVAYGVGALLGRWARWNLDKKLFVWLEWTAFAASALFLIRVANEIGTFLYLFGVDPFEPCVIAHGNFAKNGRGDLVEGQARVCSIFSSEDRIGLSLADKMDFIALVYYDQRPNSREPGFRWLDDDQLSVDLGKVTWLTPQISQLGHVKISYTYSGAEPSLE